jgi:hypothetical protein
MKSQFPSSIRHTEKKNTGNEKQNYKKIFISLCKSKIYRIEAAARERRRDY